MSSPHAPVRGQISHRESRPRASSLDFAADPKDSFKRDSLIIHTDSKIYDSGSPSKSLSGGASTGAGFHFQSRPQLTPVNKDDPTVLSWLNYLKSHGIQCVVFDLDRTLVSLHSSGALANSELDNFRHSITPACRILLPLLIDNGFQVGVATFCDDYYTQSKALFPQYSSGEHTSGLALVKAVLGMVLTAEQISKVSIVAMNPDLYGHASTPTQSRVVQMRLPRFLTKKTGSAVSRRHSMSVNVDTPTKINHSGNKSNIEMLDLNNPGTPNRAAENTQQFLELATSPLTIHNLHHRRLSGQRGVSGHHLASFDSHAMMLNSQSARHSLFLPADILESPPDSPLPQPAFVVHSQSTPKQINSPLKATPETSSPLIQKSKSLASNQNNSSSLQTDKSFNSKSNWLDRIISAFLCRSSNSDEITIIDESKQRTNVKQGKRGWFYQNLYATKEEQEIKSDEKIQSERERENPSEAEEVKLPNAVADEEFESNPQPTPPGSMPSPGDSEKPRARPKLTINAGANEPEVSKTNRAAISRVAISRANYHPSTGMIHIDSKPLQQSTKHQFYANKLNALGITVGSDKFGSAGQYPPGPYKNQHILIIYRYFNVNKRVLNGLGSMVLIDDTEENVEAARSMGCWGILVGSKSGLVVGDLFSIQKPYEQFVEIGT